MEASYDEDLTATAGAANPLLQHPTLSVSTRTDACMRCVCSHRCCQQRAERLGLKRGDHVNEADMEARQSNRYKAQQPLLPAKRKPFQPPKPAVKRDSDETDSKHESSQLRAAKQQTKPAWTVVPFELAGERKEREVRESGRVSVQLPPAGRLARLDVAGGLERGAVAMDVKEDEDWVMPSLSLFDGAKASVAASPPPLLPLSSKSTPTAPPGQHPTSSLSQYNGAEVSPAAYPPPWLPLSATSAFTGRAPTRVSANRGGNVLFEEYAVHPPRRCPSPRWHPSPQPAELVTEGDSYVPLLPPVDDHMQPVSRSTSRRVRLNNPFSPSATSTPHTSGFPAMPTCKPQFMFDFVVPHGSGSVTAMSSHRGARGPTLRTAGSVAGSRFSMDGADAALKGVNMEMRPKRWRSSATTSAAVDPGRQQMYNATSQRVHAPAAEAAAMYDDRGEWGDGSHLQHDAFDGVDPACDAAEVAKRSRRQRSPYSPSAYRRANAYCQPPQRYSGGEERRVRWTEQRDGDLYYDGQRDGGHEAAVWGQQCSTRPGGQWVEDDRASLDSGRSIFDRYSRSSGQQPTQCPARYDTLPPLHLNGREEGDNRWHAGNASDGWRAGVGRGRH